MVALIVVAVGLLLLAAVGLCSVMGWSADTTDPSWSAGQLTQPFADSHRR